MNTRRLFSIVMKELRQLRRDPRLLRVLLIAPMSHPIGNRITCKTLLSGDTVVLHEGTPETISHTPAKVPQPENRF